ncbi:MAG: hypothetical protein JRF30_05435 [Deltaproteobacteria bacterium]|nr:hypothetical protein [Deltaproteobacteria bacterium]MBW1795763.1 hypothetical protein [Deltaproteobacteria bacterium]MBW2330365.1 hypothetical protein [Deltaproteobacteria bacterium]
MLPNREQAYIPEPKLSKYVLSETHAVGKAKAKYFRSLGYTEANANELADALLMIAKSEGGSKKVTTPYGTKYIVEGELVTPSGTTARIRTVWVVEPHDKRPRFVTAYPV